MDDQQDQQDWADRAAPDRPLFTDDEPDWDDDGADGPGTGVTRRTAIRTAQVGVVVLALLVVGVALISKGGGSDEPEPKDDHLAQMTEGEAGTAELRWPGDIAGRPPAFGTRGQTASAVHLGKGAEPGVYVWSDYDGWHLWVVNGAGLPAVRGAIRADDPIAKATASVDDAGTVIVDGKVVTFDLPSDRPVVGVDFNPGFFAKNIVFTIEGPDGPIAESAVHVGSEASVAPYPLVITKTGR